MIAACPVLSGSVSGSESGAESGASGRGRAGVRADLNGNNFEWSIDEVEDCLQTLLDLQQVEGIKVEWPEGEKMKIVSRQLSFDQMKLHIHKEKDWFSATGEVQLDDSKVLDMRKLLELMQATPGRFIPVGEGQFLALTSEFRRRMDELKAFSETTAKGYKVPSPGLPRLEGTYRWHRLSGSG